MRYCASALSFNLQELAMALPVQSDQELLFEKLPACFDELPTGPMKEVAKEIYDTLVSLQKLRPDQVRPDGPSSCPAARLGRRKSRYVIERVMEGARFKVLDDLESDAVRFVGAMTGVIEAANLGAIDDTLQGLFFSRMHKLVSTLSSSKIVPVRSTKITHQLWQRVQGERRIGTGVPTFEKLHGCWLYVIRDNRTVIIPALRVIDVEFHPARY